MPPLPRLHIPAIQALERDLRFAPPAALRRQIDRLEALCAELIGEPPERVYPLDWIVFRITGYRSDSGSPVEARAAGSRSGSQAGGAALLAGRDLLADLVALIERLCDAARLAESDLADEPGPTGPEREWLDPEALCARWNVSRKTLDRFRREGLPARRVRSRAAASRAGQQGASGAPRTRLVFRRRIVEQFERHHASRLTHAGSFTRIDPEVRRKILRLAPKYHARLGWTLNQTAGRLASRFNRSHEAVRQVLRGNAHGPAQRPQPGSRQDPRRTTSHRDTPARRSFGEPGPLSPRQLRVIARAYARGVEVQRLAARFAKTKPAIYRAILVARAQPLRLLDFSAFADPEQSDQGARAVLDHPAAMLRVGPVLPAQPLRSLADLLGYVAAMPAVPPAIERAISTALLTLVHRARRGVARLSRHHPTAGGIDRIETDLRWACALKHRLVLSQMPLLLKSLRVQIGTELVELPRVEAEAILDASIKSLVDAVDRHDPSKGGRLAAPAGLAITRAVSQLHRPASSAAAQRARRYTGPADILLGDFSRRLCAWQSLLEPSPRVRANLSAVPPKTQRLLRLHFGWPAPGEPPSPPITLHDAAATLSITAQHAAALERRAIVALGRMEPVDPSVPT
ncbi:MAG: hypothetical protein AB7G11_02025 [Phycisphaerales bacterium]